MKLPHWFERLHIFIIIEKLGDIYDFLYYSYILCGFGYLLPKLSRAETEESINNTTVVELYQDYFGSIYWLRKKYFWKCIYINHIQKYIQIKGRDQSIGSHISGILEWSIRLSDRIYCKRSHKGHDWMDSSSRDRTSSRVHNSQHLSPPKEDRE